MCTHTLQAAQVLFCICADAFHVFTFTYVCPHTLQTVQVLMVHVGRLARGGPVGVASKVLGGALWPCKPVHDRLAAAVGFGGSVVLLGCTGASVALSVGVPGGDKAAVARRILDDADLHS